MILLDKILKKLLSYLKITKILEGEMQLIHLVKIAIETKLWLIFYY